MNAFEIFLKTPARSFEFKPAASDKKGHTRQGMLVTRRIFAHKVDGETYREERITMECPQPLSFR